MKKLLALSLLTLGAGSAFSGTAWLQYSIYSPGDLMIPWQRDNVCGLRLDMPYGNNKGSVTGVDFGFVGVTSGSMTGCELTLFNLADIGATKGVQFGLLANRTKDVCGVQFGGFLNWNEDEACGVQLGGLNYDGEFSGVQLGIVNWMLGNVKGVSVAGGLLLAQNGFTGCSAALLNYGLKDITGAQFGVFNVSANTSTGLQFGLVNFAKHHEGLQLGLVNLNSSGFLPCFPFFNFNFFR